MEPLFEGDGTARSVPGRRRAFMAGARTSNCGGGNARRPRHWHVSRATMAVAVDIRRPHFFTSPRSGRRTRATPLCRAGTASAGGPRRHGLRSECGRATASGARNLCATVLSAGSILCQSRRRLIAMLSVHSGLPPSMRLILDLNGETAEAGLLPDTAQSDPERTWPCLRARATPRVLPRQRARAGDAESPTRAGRLRVPVSRERQRSATGWLVNARSVPNYRERGERARAQVRWRGRVRRPRVQRSRD